VVEGVRTKGKEEGRRRTKRLRSTSIRGRVESSSMIFVVRERSSLAQALRRYFHFISAFIGYFLPISRLGKWSSSKVMVKLTFDPSPSSFDPNAFHLRYSLQLSEWSEYRYPPFRPHL